MSRKNVILISLTLAVAVMGTWAHNAAAQDKLDCTPCAQKCLDAYFDQQPGVYTDCLAQCDDCMDTIPEDSTAEDSFAI